MIVILPDYCHPMSRDKNLVACEINLPNAINDYKNKNGCDITTKDFSTRQKVEKPRISNIEKPTWHMQKTSELFDSTSTSIFL